MPILRPPLLRRREPKVGRKFDEAAEVAERTMPQVELSAPFMPEVSKSPEMRDLMREIGEGGVGLLQIAAQVRRGKLKITDVPEARRKKIQRLLDDYGKELDGIGTPTPPRPTTGPQPHVRSAKTA